VVAMGRFDAGNGAGAEVKGKWQVRKDTMLMVGYETAELIRVSVSVFVSMLEQ